MKVSIITINYNNCEGLRRTLASVFAQTSSDFEYIVIDGGSTDGSRALIEAESRRLAYWVSEPDKGVFHAMNKGVQAARGAFCLFLNSGDALHAPDTLDRLLPRLDDADFYTGHLATLHRPNDVLRAPQRISARLLVQNPLSHQATFIRTELLRKRPYREQYRLISDWEQMVFELVMQNRSYRPLDLIVADYDRTGLSSQASNRERYEAERREAIEGLFPPRVWQGLTGESSFERKVLRALTKASPLQRDWKLLRNTVKALLHDLLSGHSGQSA